MAFIDQVQDLTSLTVSDNGELSQFLKDGVLDVTNRWLSVKPQDVELFGRESSGVPKYVHEIVNERLRIPMLENKRSLNLATSVGIVLAEQLRQN